MVRISKLTDYGIVMMSVIASQPLYRYQAREIAEMTHINLPTVSKILKILARAGLLLSHRGAQGGYQLSKLPNNISVVELIQSLEGPIAITECNLGEDHCFNAMGCHLKNPWEKINDTIKGALQNIKLSDLITATTLKVHHV